jgi:Mn2+/Fe2+ NRAMP family transporter
MVLHDFVHPPHASAAFLTLLGANVGAVIMPWMVFYQQEAVIDKGQRGLNLRSAVRSARLDTAFGAVITQIVMIAVVVAAAATLGVTHRGQSLSSIGDIAKSLTPFLGHRDAVIFFGLGMIGASVVAALVVTLAGAWGTSEVLGWRHSLNDTDPGRRFLRSGRRGNCRRSGSGAFGSQPRQPVSGCRGDERLPLANRPRISARPRT